MVMSRPIPLEPPYFCSVIVSQRRATGDEKVDLPVTKKWVPARLEANGLILAGRYSRVKLRVQPSFKSSDDSLFNGEGGHAGSLKTEVSPSSLI
jgi:hypothetical protein